MKDHIIVVGFVFFIIFVGFSGCTQQDSSVEVLPSDQSIFETPPEENESIEEILEKTESIDSMYYEMIASIDMPDFGTQQATIKIWKKGTYLKEKMTGASNGFTTTISMIQRPDGTYIYNEELGYYELTTEEQSSYLSFLQYFDSELIKTYLDNETMTDFETEVIDGKTATILEYAPSDIEDSILVRLWVWNEKGLPLKAIVDMDLEDMSMYIEVLFKNYSFTEISDDTFAVS